MTGLRKIESVILSVANPEFDYMRAMERNIEFCQICGVGAPLFEVETTYAEGGPEWYPAFLQILRVEYAALPIVS